MKNRILFVYQYAFSKTGGIQTFNRYFISALEEIEKKYNHTIDVNLLSLYDDKKDIKTILKFETFDKNKNKIKLFFSFFKYAKKFDTFIFAHVNLAPLATIVNILNPKARIIFCTHGIDIWRKLPKTTEWIMNKSTILTVSNFSKKELLKYNPNLKDIRLFPNCIKLQENRNLKNPYNSENFNILSVTRLSSSEKLKGVDSVIKSLKILVKTIPNIKYTIIGKGDDVKRLKKIATELNVDKYVEFLGFVEDITPYYKYCDIFTLPSKKEGFGIVYLEAMQYKKPVIATNYAGPKDVIIDEKTGYLCEYDDEKCIAEKIELLFKNPELAKKLGENGYKRLIENFTFEHFKENLEEIILEKRI